MTTLTLFFKDLASLHAQLHDLINRAMNYIPTIVFQAATKELIMDE
jgi:hypothetical protein